MYNFNQCIMNFKLKTPKSHSSSLILFYVNLSDGSRFVYSTGQKIPVRLWDSHAQIPKKTKSQNDQMILHRIRGDLDCVHWCKRKTLRLGG
jgi:hypothetical protein